MNVKPTWWLRHRRGLLLAGPGLIVPLVGIVREVLWYASLPASLRAADGDPVPYGFALQMVFVIFLLSCMPPLLIALPRHLRLSHCIAAAGLQLIPMCIALAIAVLDERDRGWIAFALLLYVPALMAYRLLRGDRTGGPGVTVGGQVRGSAQGCT